MHYLLGNDIVTNFTKQLIIVSNNNLTWLCNIANMNRTYHYKIRRENWNPKAETLRSLCRVLDLNLSDFFRLFNEFNIEKQHNKFFRINIGEYLNGIKVYTCGYVRLCVRYVQVDKSVSLYELPIKNKLLLHTFLTNYSGRENADITMLRLLKITNAINIPLYEFLEQIEYIAYLDMIITDVNFSKNITFSYFKSLSIF